MQRISVNDIVPFVSSVTKPNHTNRFLKVLPILIVFILKVTNCDIIFLRPLYYHKHKVGL